ncbi:MAG: hypothetical protein II820_01280 [Ruminiclostridium sp.]|nr:hypothetical protein [Ruminiclostridium sp.]
MKKLYENHKGLFITVIVLISAVLFYFFCYISWAFFYGGDYTFRNEIYNVNMFGSFTMTDKKGETHTGSLKPMDYNPFINKGEYVLCDDTTGKIYPVIKCSQGGTNYLSYRCPICDSPFMTQDIKDTQNAGRLNTYGVCLDCIESKNKYLSLFSDIDPEIFDTNLHPIDGKCDICGSAAAYTDKYEEYCENHLDCLVSSIESVIPHWCDCSEIDVSEFSAATKICFQIGTVKMREEGYLFELDCPDKGIDYYEYNNLTGEYELEENKLVEGIQGEAPLATLLSNNTAKFNPLKGSKSEYTLCLNVTKPDGEVKQIKLVKNRP